MLDADQSAVFRSGLGLALYLAMDRPDIQFAVKTLASYMARPSVKALSALKHLASYLDGTADDGLFLQSTEENQCIFDGWRNDEVIDNEVNVPNDQSEARFNLEAFSDSSWADCKATRKSTSSGLVFLNGALVLSICRTQASVALSSCEAELYAANGLMVECMFLYRLCKFLCGDSSETNSSDVQQRLYIDSSSAMALMQRAGTGRLKHVQIRQFFLQSLLRAGIFTVHKISTKLNPGDFNTKRLSGERRKFLGRLIGIYMSNLDEENNDSEIRKVRRVNQATRQQCVRLVQLAAATLGLSVQLKGCSSEPMDKMDNSGSEWAMVTDVMNELIHSSVQAAIAVTGTMCRYFILTIGVMMLVVSAIFIYLGPLTWTYSITTRWLETKHPAKTMGWRHTLFLQPSLMLARWLLGCEIKYLHERFRAAGQTGDMMVDIESIHADLNEYLNGERFRANPPRDPIDVPMQQQDEGEGEEEESAGHDPSVDGDGNGDENGDDLVNMALSGQRMNLVDGAFHPAAEEVPEHGGGDVNMPGESLDERYNRYLNSSQDEVSEPDEWANVHYSHLDQHAYERLVAYSRANRIRLNRAAATVRSRHDAAASQGNWEEAANCLRALRDLESLMDIA